VIKKDQTIFYVYVFLRAKDSEHGKKGTPYYVGKGHGNRAFSFQRKGAPRPQDDSYIAFIQEGLTEQEALSLERYCISLYGRIDIGTGILRNLTDGGDGVCGLVFSEDTIEAMRVRNSGKQLSDETKRRIGLANKGKTIPAETRQKMAAAKECNVYEITDPDGNVYECSNLREFAKTHGLQVANLSSVARGERGHHKGWTVRMTHSASIHGRQHAPSSIEEIRKQKELYKYEMISPLGDSYITHNLSQFAADHELSQAALSCVVNGKRNHHKGWTGRILEKLK
jgi:hypothetical protein